MDIIVENCHLCPFSNWSISGRRLSHYCRLQRLGKQWKESNLLKKEGYDCFKTCPLKTENINVSFKTT